MDGAVFFVEAASGTFCLVWVSAICFWFDLEDGFSMCLCPYLEKTLITLMQAFHACATRRCRSRWSRPAVAAALALPKEILNH